MVTDPLGQMPEPIGMGTLLLPPPLPSWPFTLDPMTYSSLPATGTGQRISWQLPSTFLLLSHGTFATLNCCTALHHTPITAFPRHTCHNSSVQFSYCHSRHGPTHPDATPHQCGGVIGDGVSSSKLAIGVASGTLSPLHTHEIPRVHTQHPSAQMVGEWGKWGGRHGESSAGWIPWCTGYHLNGHDKRLLVCH